MSMQNEEGKRITSDNLEVPGAGLPEAWMLELAQMLILKDLPTGVIVGSAVIEEVTRGSQYFEWHLGGIERGSGEVEPTLRSPDCAREGIEHATAHHFERSRSCPNGRC